MNAPLSVPRHVENYVRGCIRLRANRAGLGTDARRRAMLAATMALREVGCPVTALINGFRAVAQESKS